MIDADSGETNAARHLLAIWAKRANLLISAKSKGVTYGWFDFEIGWFVQRDIDELWVVHKQNRGSSRPVAWFPTRIGADRLTLLTMGEMWRSQAGKAPLARKPLAERCSLEKVGTTWMFRGPNGWARFASSWDAESYSRVAQMPLAELSRALVTAAGP